MELYDSPWHYRIGSIRLSKVSPPRIYESYEKSFAKRPAELLEEDDAFLTQWHVPEVDEGVE